MHVILWEFRSRHGCEREFEAAYGPQGEWASLFSRGEEYRGSELLADAASPGRYLVIDRWESKAAFMDFRSRWADDYEKLDRRCEKLTESEARLGSFDAVRWTK
jgi:heme-degrading monooxygenase HmoA